MPALLERVTIFCFAASYGTALLLELLSPFQPRPVQRLLGLAFGFAGFVAHTIYLAVQPVTLAAPFGSLLFLAWILAVFYLYGTVHHRRQAWGLFVLPLVLGLVVLAQFSPRTSAHTGTPMTGSFLSFLQGERFWGRVHGGLVLLAAVGVCVGFVASVMYLVQVYRLRHKVAPDRGVRLLSLERLEAMNRRAVVTAFPLLTAGLLVGVALMLHTGDYLADWTSPKVLSAAGLWVVFAILLFLRYGVHVRGRAAALWTIMAFALLLVTLTAPAHPFAPGGDAP